MRATHAVRGTLVLLAALCAVLITSLATAGAKPRRIVFGSTLTATPKVMPHAAYRSDAEFWNTSLGSARLPSVRSTVGAPRNGLITAIRLKTGNDSRSVKIRISVIRRAGGGYRVVTTSTPHWNLPAHSPGVHTFSTRGLQFRMPLQKGDLVALDTPGVKPRASVWFGAVPGATVQSYAAHGATQNEGAHWRGTAHGGFELLLQVVEQPGR